MTDRGCCLILETSILRKVIYACFTTLRTATNPSLRTACTKQRTAQFCWRCGNLLGLVVQQVGSMLASFLVLRLYYEIATKFSIMLCNITVHHTRKLPAMTDRVCCCFFDTSILHNVCCASTYFMATGNDFRIPG